MKKMLIGLFAASAFVLLIAYSEGTRPAREAEQKAERAETQRKAEEVAKIAAEMKSHFVAKVLARIPNVTKSATVTFDSVDSGREVTAKIEFPQPISNSTAEDAAMMTTQAVIDTLMADGHSVRMMFIFTSVHALTAGSSGRTMYLLYGNARYNPASDQIVFKPT